jgi:CubicO group peptidase (beta-lactamase class C family)
MPPILIHPNPDLTVGADLRPRWNSAPHRRQGFHNLHRLTRYGSQYRAGQVMDLRLSADLSVAARPDVRALTASPWFSAMAVIEGNRLLYERYAPDFGPDQPHSIMSISKMSVNLIIGRLWEEGKIALDATVGSILPGMGAGYHGARVQDVLNMNVQNAYDEDYHNAETSAFLHEAAMGMRLPVGPEPTNRDFIHAIGLAAEAVDTVNPTGLCLYKSANTEVLALVAEACGARPLGAWMADLADAAGVEGALHVQTDRVGQPILNGGICLTARDLCRYGAIFARMGAGVDGRPFGSAAFLRATQAGGIAMPAPRAHLRYANQTNTNGVWFGHGGYGGQYMVANPETGRVAVFLSVLQDEDGYDSDYYPPIIAMLSDICAGA